MSAVAEADRAADVAERSHTPGPWISGEHFAERHGARTYIPIMRPGNDPVPLAAVHRDVDCYGRSEGEANAHLIAAAPDLKAFADKLVIYSVGHLLWISIDGVPIVCVPANSKEASALLQLEAQRQAAVGKATGGAGS